MTKQIALKDRILRDDHFILNPVTAEYEAALLLEGNHYSTRQASTAWLGAGAQEFFATKTANATTAPDGTTTADRLISAANTVYHRVVLTPLQGNGDPFQGFPAELANRPRAFQFYFKSGPTLDGIEVRTYAEDGSGFVIDRFSRLGTKTSGTSKIYIEPAVPNDPSYADWWRVFSYGLKFPASGTISNIVELYLVKGGLGFNAGNGFAGTVADYVDVWGIGFENASAQCQLPMFSTPISEHVWGSSPGAEHVAIPLLGVDATPAASTIYMEWLERGNAVMANASVSARESGILRIGDMPRTAANSLEIKQTATGFTGTLNNGGVTSVSTLALAPTRDQLIALRATISATGVLQLHASINGGAETAGTAGDAAGLPASWNETVVSLNSLGVSLFGDMALRRFKVLEGVVPLALVSD